MITFLRFHLFQILKKKREVVKHVSVPQFQRSFLQQTKCVSMVLHNISSLKPITGKQTTDYYQSHLG